MAIDGMHTKSCLLCIYHVFMQVGIRYPSRTVYYTPPEEAEKQIIKGISTKAYLKVGKWVTKHKSLLPSTVTALGRVLRAEIKAAAAHLRVLWLSSSSNTLSAFNWADLHQQLRSKCPRLLQMLLAILPPRKRARMNHFMCFLVSMLAKATNKKASLVQSLISLLLLYGHASTQASIQQCVIMYI